MSDISLLSVLLAATVAFVISSTWYVLFARQLGSGGVEGLGSPARPPLWKVGVELLRSSMLALVLAGLSHGCGINRWSDGLLLALSLWVGFPLVLWVGAVVWEGTSIRLAAIHAGEWLVKLLAIASIVSTWR